MRRNGEEWKKAPRWMKELHAWQAGKRGRIELTVPRAVSPEFSRLRPALTYGIEGLRMLGTREKAA